MEDCFDFADLAVGFFEVFEFGPGAGAVHFFKLVEFKEAGVKFFFFHWPGVLMMSRVASLSGLFHLQISIRVALKI